MLYEEAVVLVPGFFGFGRFGNFFYFADRVTAALRSSLQARLGRSVPILSIASVPAGSLIERQKDLLIRLERVNERLGGVRNFHLVGHSTGGVDAELLTRAAPADSHASWDALDPRGLRKRIASICTIASPHYGTHLVESAAAGFVANPLRAPQGALDASRIVFKLLEMLGDRVVTLEVLEGAARSLPATFHFTLQLLCERDMVADLAPAEMERRRAENPRENLCPVASFVTVTPPKPERMRLFRRRPDALFRELYDLTSRAGEVSANVRTALGRINAERHLAVRNPAAHLDEIGPGDSDGVVNTGRQLLLPSREHDANDAYLAGVIVADHADVIGHYDREDPLSYDWLGRSKPINSGFFRSGSAFGDDEFFRLYDAVAHCVAQPAERRARSEVEAQPGETAESWSRTVKVA